MNRRRLSILFASLAAAVLLARPVDGVAATCTCNKTGNWDNSGGTGVIWAAGCGAGGPVAGDTVVIPNSFTVTIPAGVAAAAGSLQVGNNTNGATALTFAAATSSLAVSGNASI